MSNRIKNLKSKIKNRSGFSLVELLVVIVIIGILSVVSYVAINKAGSKAKNEKMLNDLIMISSALEDYKRDHEDKYPIPTPDDKKGKPNQNIICYYMDATYAHSCDPNDGAVFTQGMMDNKVLSKRYLRQVPLDPRTNSRYVYGVTNDGQYYQIAGIYEDGDDFTARVIGNLAKGFELPSIIRAFDKADFVIDKGSNLPYSSNPTEITGTLDNISGSGKITVNAANGSTYTTDNKVKNGFVVKNKDTIITEGTRSVDIYFSDGSITHLDVGSNLYLKDLKVDKNDGSGTVTRILIKLNVGKIWNKVVRLSEKSEFNVETTTAIAGVRGTEFGVSVPKKDGDPFDVTVLAGKVDIYKDAATIGTTINTVSGTITSPQLAKFTSKGATMNTSNASLSDIVKNYYKDIPLNVNMRPVILSVKGASNEINVQNINYYVDQVNTNLKLNAGSRIVDATDLVAYADNQGKKKISVISPNTNPFNIVGSKITYKFKGIPLGKPIYLRFEKRVGNTILRSSAFTTPITIQSKTSLTKSDLKPKVISTSRPELTLNAPRFAVASKNFKLDLDLNPYTWKSGDKYIVKKASTSTSCKLPTALQSTGEILITAQASKSQNITIDTTAIDGICEIRVQANIGSLSLIKIVKVRILKSSDKLVLTYPLPGKTGAPTTLKKAGKQVTFRWTALNPPKGVTYNFRFGNSPSTTGIKDQFYAFTLPAKLQQYTWRVTMVDNSAPKQPKTLATATGYVKVEAATNVDFIITRNLKKIPNQTKIPAAGQLTPVVVDAPFIKTLPKKHTYKWTLSGFDTPPATPTNSFTANVKVAKGSSKYASVTLTVRDDKNNLVDTVTKGFTVERLPMINGIQFKTPPSAAHIAKKAGDYIDLPRVVFTTNIAGSSPVELSPSDYKCDTTPQSGMGTFTDISSTKKKRYTANANKFSSGTTKLQIICKIPKTAKVTGYSINTIHMTASTVKIAITKTATTPATPILASTCSSKYKGVWDGPPSGTTNGCWFVASSANDSCDSVCTGKGLKCAKDTKWIVSSGLCKALGTVSSKLGANVATNYSPIFIQLINECSNHTGTLSRSCNVAPSSQKNAKPKPNSIHKRLCKCVQ